MILWFYIEAYSFEKRICIRLVSNGKKVRFWHDTRDTREGKEMALNFHVLYLKTRL